MSVSDESVSQAAHATAVKASAAVGYGGASGAVYFGLTANEVAAFAGVVIGAIGMALNVWLNWHWKAQHFALEKSIAERNRKILD